MVQIRRHKEGMSIFMADQELTAWHDAVSITFCLVQTTSEGTSIRGTVVAVGTVPYAR